MTARLHLAISIAVLITIPTLAAPKKSIDRQPTAVVLCYHIVEAPQDPRMEISRETFRQQMEYLELTGYNVIPLQHLYEYVAGKRKTIPQNSVVITIDDGWRSTYTEAFPEMKKRGWPFTVFIYPRIIGRTANALSWKQIREMSEAGVDIQSHSLSHGYLSKRKQASRGDAYYGWLATELAESKKILEKEVGQDVSFLAYPYGDYDHGVVAAAGKAGYEAALTCEFGRVRRGSDPLRMKRYVIDGRMDFATFRRYMGASPMMLADINPKPGQPATVDQASISAKIPRHESVDPRSVGMAIMGAGSGSFPFSYDAKTGSITVALNDAMQEMKGKIHRAVVWATDSQTGKRVEGTWVFRVADPAAPPVEVPVARPAAAITPQPARENPAARAASRAAMTASPVRETHSTLSGSQR
jgi:peptidoglycan/xylan/chitin deacetylase (PgdA/CDA1 family)